MEELPKNIIFKMIKVQHSIYLAISMKSNKNEENADVMFKKLSIVTPIQKNDVKFRFFHKKNQKKQCN